jgi:hypothetical protein
MLPRLGPARPLERFHWEIADPARRLAQKTAQIVRRQAGVPKD